MIIWTKQDILDNVEHMLAAPEISFMREGLKPLLPKTYGHIVELGPWLGGSTCLLNPHLRNSENHYVWDNFKWANYMAKRKPNHSYSLGDSFLEEFKKNTAHLKNLKISTHYLQEAPPFLKPIRILFIDAFKSTPAITKGSVNFYPNLVKNAIILDQDFFFHLAGHQVMHLLMYFLRGFVEPLYRAGTTCVWRVNKTMPVEAINSAIEQMGITHFDYTNCYITRSITVSDLARCYEYWSNHLESEHPWL